MKWSRVASLFIAAVASGGVIGCSGSDDPPAEVLSATEIAPSSTEPTTTPTEASTTTAASTTSDRVELVDAAVERRASGVGRTDRLLVDLTRPTVEITGVSVASDERRLPTIVLYPSTDPDPGVVEPGATPAEGPFPLVVVSHGLTGTAEQLTATMTRIAAAGYVVAAPDFPETTGGSDFAAFPRFVAQPGDVSFVIDQLLADPELGPVIDADRIATGGHSLGGLTTYGVSFNSCCRDDRIDAAFTLAGAFVPYPGGEYDFAGGPPLLLIHGDADGVVPYEWSTDIIATRPESTYLLTLLGEDHSAGLDPADAGFEETADAIVAFLDRWVIEDPRADSSLAAVAVAGVTTLQD